MANPNTAIFPAALPGDANLMVATNDAYSTLTQAINSSQTDNIVVGEAFDVPCLIRIGSELIYCGSKVGNIYGNAIRGYGGTSTASHDINSPVYGFIEAHHHNQLAAEIKAICTALGINLANVIKTTTESGGDASGTFGALTIGQVGGVSAANIMSMWLAYQAQPYDIPLYLIGKPPGGTIIFKMKFVRNVSFPADFAGSKGAAPEIDATATTTFSVKKNGVEIGTIAVATDGTYTFATTDGDPQTFAVDDILTVVSPTQDATLEGFGCTLVGTR